jgi:hypothetical protein
MQPQRDFSSVASYKTKIALPKPTVEGTKLMLMLQLCALHTQLHQPEQAKKISKKKFKHNSS